MRVLLPLPVVLPLLAAAVNVLLARSQALQRVVSVVALSGVLATALAVSLLSSAIPYTLEMEALRRLPEAVFGVLMSIEPAVAALAGFLVLGESLSTREVVAILFVVAASAGAARHATVATRDA